MRIMTTSAIALSAAFLLAGASPSFAKAHDQGLAKGTVNNERTQAKAGRFSGSTPETAQGVAASRAPSHSNAGMKSDNGDQPSSDNARAAAGGK